MAKHSCPFSISWVGLNGVFIPVGQQWDEGLKCRKCLMQTRIGDDSPSELSPHTKLFGKPGGESLHPKTTKVENRKCVWVRMSGALVWATRVAECSHLPELWLLPSACSSQASPLVERAQNYGLTSCAHLLPLVWDPTRIPHAHGSYTTNVKKVGLGGHEQLQRAYSCQWQQTLKLLLCVLGVCKTE